MMSVDPENKRNGEIEQLTERLSALCGDDGSSSRFEESVRHGNPGGYGMRLTEEEIASVVDKKPQ